jgi:hypothetical protein
LLALKVCRPRSPVPPVRVTLRRTWLWSSSDRKNRTAYRRLWFSTNLSNRNGMVQDRTRASTVRGRWLSFENWFQSTFM